jgi:hypothetical protein
MAIASVVTYTQKHTHNRAYVTLPLVGLQYLVALEMLPLDPPEKTRETYVTKLITAIVHLIKITYSMMQLFFLQLKCSLGSSLWSGE